MRHPSLRVAGLLLAAALALPACTSADSEPAPSPSVGALPSSTPTPAPSPAPALPALAQAPPGDMNLWATTIGLPVTAAIRTSTPLARLAGTPAAERVTVCRQVASELDTIAPPPLLSGLAITADSETATLLVGDLQAKADLLAACETGGTDLDALIDEVARTHAVAVAWLALLRGGA